MSYYYLKFTSRLFFLPLHLIEFSMIRATTFHLLSTGDIVIIRFTDAQPITLFRFTVTAQNFPASIYNTRLLLSITSYTTLQKMKWRWDSRCGYRIEQNNTTFRYHHFSSLVVLLKLSIPAHALPATSPFSFRRHKTAPIYALRDDYLSSRRLSLMTDEWISSVILSLTTNAWLLSWNTLLTTQDI